ncbi:MAG: phage integrase SAM-like domain-containing protein [Alistipes sp.]|nr:phage integrase SAM-like domain-containing protein [Candidatus Alistipes equi]
MATFKAEVYAHQKKADGTWNIKIRVIHNQRKKYISTSWYVGKEDLTRNLKLKNQTYIDYTDELIKSYRKICDRKGEALKGMSVEDVVKLLKDGEQSPVENFDLDIVAFGREHVAKLKAAGHNGNARSYEVAINNLVKFVGRERVSVKEITSRFVRDWVTWIDAQPAPKNKKKGTRAKSLYPSQLRAIHNLAKKEYNDEDTGVIKIPLSPFRDLPKVEPARKRALTAEQLLSIRDLKDTLIYQNGQNRYNLAKDVFVMSFLLIGMNEADLYECSDCKGGRITYQRVKTRNRRSDKAEISVKIEPELEPYMEKYKDPTGERVFKFYKMYSNVGTFTNALNKGLKVIGKSLGIDDLEFYSARHTWATIAANDAEVDKYTVHTALNHVDEKMKVTDTYIKKSWKPIDKANRKVLDYLKTCKPCTRTCALRSE